MTDLPASPAFVTPFRVRSYELDSLGHLNHAVYLNYLEQARFDALAAGGFPLSHMEARGWGVHVVRIEADYRRECRLGDPLVCRTAVARFRNSSMTIHQALYRFRAGEDTADPDTSDPAPPLTEPAALAALPELDPEAGALALEARVVAVWIGADGRPMRIPAEVRRALGADDEG